MAVAMRRDPARRALASLLIRSALRTARDTQTLFLSLFLCRFFLFLSHRHLSLRDCFDRHEEDRQAENQSDRVPADPQLQTPVLPPPLPPAASSHPLREAILFVRPPHGDPPAVPKLL